MAVLGLWVLLCDGAAGDVVFPAWATLFFLFLFNTLRGLIIIGIVWLCRGCLGSL